MNHQCTTQEHTTDYTTAQQTRIWVDWKTGVHARDWDALAKKENLNAMAAELNKLEETVKDILQEMAYLRRREEEMRNINGVWWSACLHTTTTKPCQIQRLPTAVWPGFRSAPCSSVSR